MKNEQVKHTPGPWRMRRHHNNSSFEVYATGNNHICQIDHWGIREVDLTAELKPEGQPESNARLIAASPELLSLIQEINCWLTAPDLSPSVVQAYKHDCELAIAHATGSEVCK